jgi:hypothetical protein
VLRAVPDNNVSFSISELELTPLNEVSSKLGEQEANFCGWVIVVIMQKDTRVYLQGPGHFDHWENRPNTGHYFKAYMELYRISPNVTIDVPNRCLVLVCHRTFHSSIRPAALED